MVNNFFKKEKPVLGLIGLGGGATSLFVIGGGGGEYWYLNVIPYDSADNSGNPCVPKATSDAIFWGFPAADTDPTVNTHAAVIKLDKFGATQWVKQIKGTGTNAGKYIYSTDVVVDSSGNVFVTYNEGGASSTIQLFTAKLSGTDGSTLDFSAAGEGRYLNSSASSRLEDNKFHSTVVDSSDNLYRNGREPLASPVTFIEKFNNTGTRQWMKTQGYDTNSIFTPYPTWTTIDNVDNVYFTGFRYEDNTNYNQQGCLFKYSETGNLTWQAHRRPVTSSDGTSTWMSEKFWTCVVDSSGNVYVAGGTTDTSQTQQNCFLKFDSSGTFKWAKTIVASNDTATLGKGISLAIDSDDNLYLNPSDSQVASSASQTHHNILKLDVTTDVDNPSISWVRRFSTTLTDHYGYFMIEIDTTGDTDVMMVSFKTNNSSHSAGEVEGYYLWRLPTDGSLTGTYGDWAYDAPTGGVTFSVANSTDASGGGSNTDATGSSSDAGYTVTNTTLSPYVDTLTTVP